MFATIVSGKVAVEHISAAISGALTEEDRMNVAIELFWKLEEVNGKDQISGTTYILSRDIYFGAMERRLSKDTPLTV